MLTVARTTTLALALALFGAHFAPDTASAQTREYTGEVEEVSDDGITVAKGDDPHDKIGFQRLDETAVEGAKTAWDDLSQGDCVSVAWKLMDRPRKAYKVTVVPEEEAPKTCP